jgi:membrane protease YdiL (CAAX protease family)
MANEVTSPPLSDSDLALEPVSPPEPIFSPPEPEKPTWTPRSAIWMLLAFVGVQIAAALALVFLVIFTLTIFAIAAGNLTPGINPLELPAIASAIPWVTAASVPVGFLASLWLLKAQSSHRRTKPLWDSRELTDGRAWLYLLGAVVVNLGAGAVLSPFVSNAEGGAEKTMNDLLAGGSGSLPILLMGFAVICLAPIAEEWLFRGILQPAFTERWNGTVALLLTAALFALIHLSIILFPIYMLYGLTFGLLVQRRKSLTFAIIAHVSWNALVMVSLFFRHA